MKIFDSHTHLNATDFDAEVPALVSHAKELEVTQMAIVGFDTPSIKRAFEITDAYDNLFAIVGWHPEVAGDYNEAIEKQLIADLDHDKVVAMGEMGLDYHWDTAPHDVQQKVFARQLEIAKSLHLPISVHNRDAIEDTYAVLKAGHVEQNGGIMHSFNGSAEWMEKFLDLGMYISFSGVVSFKNAPLVHEAANQVPLDRFLVETDAPYLTPMPYRGKRNEPAYTRYVVEAIAQLRKTTPEVIAAASYDNAHRIFGINHD